MVYLISRKYSVATEFAIPIFGVFVTLFCLPTWIEKPRAAKFIAHNTLAQTVTFVYIMNSFLVYFFTSHYMISLAGRSLLTINLLNMSLRKWASGDTELVPPLYNFILLILFHEVHCYNLNVEKVKLFLEKEANKMKERQKHVILQNMPTNVLVLSDFKVVFKNNHADCLIQAIGKELRQDTVLTEESAYDETHAFLHSQIFKAILRPNATSRPLRGPILVSILDIIGNKKLMSVSKHFEVNLSDGSKRIFTLTKEPIALENQPCEMLLLQEQTAFVELEKEREFNVGIKFANQCISNQLMDPLQTISQYADILLNKLAHRPEVVNLIEAIKYCNRMIQFNIQNLQDVTNIAQNHFKIKKERVDPRELLQEVVDSNKMQARKKNQGIVLLIDDSVPKFIDIDPLRMQQIVNNLLTNAIKFSDEGTRIDIESYYMPDKELLQVSVIDNGIPISDEEALTLFQPHATLQKARDINAAGPGLGLYMCRCLCNQMGGNIKLLNKIEKSVGDKAFVVNLVAPTLSNTIPDEILDMDSIGFQAIN